MPMELGCLKGGGGEGVLGPHPAKILGGREPTKIFKLKKGLNFAEKCSLLSLGIPIES